MINSTGWQQSFRQNSVHAAIWSRPRSGAGSVASTDSDLKTAMADLSERIYLAFQTLRRLPDRERGYLTADRRGSWPTVILTYWEAYGQSAVRMKLPPPSAAAISDMEEVMGWLAWLGRIDRHVMTCTYVCCGRGLEPSQAANILGLHRNTVRIKRDEGLRMIAGRFLR